MKILDFNVQEPYLGFIKSGQKTVEGRLNKGKFKALQVGDFLKLTDGSNLQFEITGKRTYESFSEMITSEGVENVIPDKENIEEATKVYYKFYTPKQEKEFGVVAIEIEKR